MSQSPYVIDVDNASFERLVLEASKSVPVVVDFWAAWCGPCKALGPILESLAHQAQGAWILAKVDTDKSPEISKRYQVRGIPAVKAFRDGQVVQEFVGVKPQEFIEQWLEGLIPSGPELLMKEANRALDERRFEDAVSLIEGALAQQPGEARLTLMLAQALAGLKQLDRAKALVDSIPSDVGVNLGEPYARIWFTLESARYPEVEVLEQRVEQDPNDIEAAYALGICLSAQGEYERALASLLEVVKRDRAFGEDAGRLAMIKLFNVMGLGDLRTLKWQQRLGQVMYI